MHFITYIYRYLYSLYLSILYYIGLQTPIVVHVNEEKKYVEGLTRRFLKGFERPPLNENIDPLFYDKEKYAKYMMEANTELEKQWKTRVLFENTPRGNIVLYYDPYKLGFSYFCDQKSVPYDILNAVAMKYVCLYRCAHFFIDESVLPQEYKSTTFIKIHFEEKRDKKGKYGKAGIQNTIRNKFIYLGKINNYSWLQNIPSRREKEVSWKLSTPLIESIRPKGNLTYRDYKKSAQK